MKSLFLYPDFRGVIAELVTRQKRISKGFNFSKLAEVLGIQKTYMSKIMNGHGQLNTDQVYTLSDFFNLTKEEHDYIILLIEHERTGLAKRKRFLEKKIASIQAEHRSTKKALQAKFSEGREANLNAEYYLDPFMTVAHIFLTLPRYAGDTKKVAQKLNFSEAYSKKIFSTLEQIGLIEKLNKPDCYRVVEDHLHLASDSWLTTPYHALFRMTSVQHLMKLSPEERFAFSVTFSADPNTRKFVHEAFLKFLREIEPAVKAAPSEDVYQLNFDLFSWS